MKHNQQQHCSRRASWTFWTVGLASTVWLLLRSGSSPRRLSYPCQQAALATTTGFVGALATMLGITTLYHLLRRTTTLRGLSLLGLTLLLVLGQTGSGVRVHGAPVAVLDLPAWTSPTAVSDVFVVKDVATPECSLADGRLPTSGACSDPAVALSDDGVDRLVAEMDSRGERFYAAGGNEGVIGADDVVVIKINDQWGGLGDGPGLGRLSTNTDVLKGLIWRVVQHPEGFSGEIVVAENTQEANPGWQTEPANAQDQGQSFQDVVDVFQGLGYPVSLATWDDLNYNMISGGSVDGGYPIGEYARGNDEDAYILLEDPAGTGTDELSYPKFSSERGTRISLRYGVWDGASYDPDRLTFINLPVLKRHGMAGATIAWKNLIGMVTTWEADSRYGDWDAMHDYYWGYTGTRQPDYGLIGRQLALIRAPDLHIVDAIWVGYEDNTSGQASRQDVLLASSDPFALDWYASQYVLRPLATWDAQDTSAALAGTFRDATRTNQNAAALVWPGGAYPYIDLLDDVDGGSPSPAERDQMNVYVAGGAAACTLSCDASVPSTAGIDEPVVFAGTATASGCSSGPAFQWDFGDGASSSEARPTHEYDAAGSYDWSLTVTADDLLCTDSGTIEVGELMPVEALYLVPAVVHAPGEAGTQWRTAMACLNLSSGAVRMAFTLVTTEGSSEHTIDLGPGASVAWQDVVVDLFAGSAGDATAGAVHVAADGAVLVTSRTYNQAAVGTFGQYLPALGVEHGLGSGDTGYLLQLASNDDFRTNVGAANLGDGECRVRIQLYDASGGAIGSTHELTVAAGRWAQVNDIFAATGAGTVSLAYATVEVVEGSSVWAYASVVDNHTGDATTIPVLREQ